MSPQREVWLRRIATALLVALGGWSGVSIDHWMQQELELVRYQSVIQEIASLMRAMPARAKAKQTIVRLRVDPSRGLLQLTALRDGPASYETVEDTIWLPEGLQIHAAPGAFTALPTGQRSSSFLMIAAPAHQKLFRFTTGSDGIVRLEEEPLS